MHPDRWIRVAATVFSYINEIFKKTVSHLVVYVKVLVNQILVCYLWRKNHLVIVWTV